MTDISYFIPNNLQGLNLNHTDYHSAIEYEWTKDEIEAFQEVWESNNYPMISGYMNALINHQMYTVDVSQELAWLKLVNLARYFALLNERELKEQEKTLQTF